jgi:formylglycine-generating enzyme required for sulfatase activity
MRYRTPFLALLLLTLAFIVFLLLTFGPWGAGPSRSTKLSLEVGPDMVFIPGGTFVMGTNAATVPILQQRFNVRRRELFDAEIPAHPVTVAPFYMDKHEVTNEQFQAFFQAHPEWGPDRIPRQFHNGEYLKDWHGTAYPPGQARHPVVQVSWYAAVAYAHWAGKRLPTEAEWEHAARGGLSGKQFPWGDEDASPDRAKYGAGEAGGPAAVGTYPANGFGLYDMAGNVWEYCLDEWGPYLAGPHVNPVGGGSLYEGDTFRAVTTRRVIRGGSWQGAPVNLRVAYRDSHPAEGAGPHVGFRCVRPAAPASQGN